MGGPTLSVLLGPTNTGKTHRAIERMLEHDTGMLGLPLRLLAREVYDRITAERGEQQVALVTGEEKRIPPRPRYWVCTVEAMPLLLEVDFLAVDEVQLMAHPQRGHVFTDRVLHARGKLETWFLGSHTALPLLKQLLPSAHYSTRPRLSQLRHRGALSLGQLPPRSAVVCFSTPEVYRLAELLRRRKGGAAVVLGALSPRTRNAQVAMFQAGEVQFLVATDAIGMGLNLSVNHVALAALHKFDGRQTRPLQLSELGQIAGRAGRHLADGSFGTLLPCPALSDGAARNIEEHRFASERHAWWRNSDLDFSSLTTLIESLTLSPKRPMLKRVEPPDDAQALLRLSVHPEVRRWARGAERVQLLWQVCGVPDYRKLLPEVHASLLFDIYAQLMSPAAQLTDDWLHSRVERLNDTQGDLETLLGRIAFVRTWIYLCHQAAWVSHAAHWQAHTRSIEDRLSDALHERLVQRFVERTRRHVGPSTNDRTSAHPFAKLAALQLPSSMPAHPSDSVEAYLQAPHAHFTLTSKAVIEVDGTPLGRLRRGRDLLHPEVSVEPGVRAGEQLRLERRLRAFARDKVDELLTPLQPQAQDSAALRGLLYQLRQSLGCALRQQVHAQLAELPQAERSALPSRGIVLAEQHVWARPLFDVAALRTRAALCAVHYQLALGELPEVGAARWPRPKDTPTPALLAAGYAVHGAQCIRCDAAEANPERRKRARKRRRRRASEPALRSNAPSVPKTTLS